MLSCQNKSINKRAQLPAIRIIEQPILLTKRKTNRPGYKFSKNLPKKLAVKSRTRFRPPPRIVIFSILI